MSEKGPTLLVGRLRQLGFRAFLRVARRATRLLGVREALLGRTPRGDPAAIVPAVREALKKIEPVLPIYDVGPLTAYVEGANATRAFTMQLAVIFALVVIALASVGIYGVIAYSVTLRHREFGVRRALGAGAAQVVALVARDGAKLLTRGILAGLADAALVTWCLRGLLFGVSPWDVTTYAAAIPVLLIAGVIACVLPARRALTTNPADALRAE